MLVILSGVSGAGKDTIKKELMKRDSRIISLPSYTSRKPREGEEEGVQYHFITKAVVFRMRLGHKKDIACHHFYIVPIYQENNMK